MIKPISKKSVYKEVFNSIIEMINNQEFVNGDKLPGEVELSESFQVSRNSVREALKSLEILGIVSSKSGTGTVVCETALRNIKYLNMINQLNDDNIIREMWQTRIIIEPELTYLAIKNATDKDIKKIVEIADLTLDVFKNEIYNWDYGRQFHEEIYAISNNSLLRNFLTATLNELTFARFDYNLRMNYERIYKDTNDHKFIADCFVNKDPEKGKEIMRKHLQDAMNLLYEEE